MKYIGVVGSREFNNEELLFRTLNGFLEQFTYITLVSGGAKGADTLAKKYAISKNINIIEYLPDYEKYGKIAPFVRNTQIIEKSELVIACFRTDLPCNGTKDSVHKASEHDIPVIFLMSEF